MDSEEKVLVDIALDEVCPICLEGDDLFMLSCSHHLHLECAKGMTDAVCPLCRSSLRGDLPSNILSSIENRGQEYQANLEAEDFARLNNLQNFDFARAVTLFVRPRPHIEVRSATNYLIRKGIPLEFLPKRIRIDNPRGHPPPQPGTIFNLLVGQALSRMQAVVGETSSDSESEGDTSSSESETEEDVERRMLNMLNARPTVDLRVYDPET